MKTIQLNSMELRNFKGVQSANYNFSNETQVVGANGTGKSTIYEAYLWCLFDKNQQGNATKVQPLDENNEVKHKLTTSVKLHFSIDGNPFIVERVLKEDWSKPRGTAEMVLKGTTSEYAINEVPMTKTQFNDKLTEVLALDRWFILSSINIIPSLDQKSCRKALQEIAPEFDEMALAAEFPYVHYALSKGLKVEEIAAMTKQNKAKAKAELDSIPAALDAQDRLRVVEDFGALEKELAGVDVEIKVKKAELDEMKKGFVDEDEVAKANALRARLADLSKNISDMEVSAMRACNDQKSKISGELANARTEASAMQVRVDMVKFNAKCALDTIAVKEREIEQLRKDWMKKNEEPEPQFDTICPTCGQPLPADQIEKARENWLEKKAKALLDIQHDAEDIKAKIDGIKVQNEKERVQLEADTNRLEEVSGMVDKLTADLAAVPNTEALLADDAEYQKLRAEKMELEEEIKKASEERKSNDNAQEIEAKNERLNELIQHRDELIRKLAGRETNERIDCERKRLEERQRELGDLLAEYEGTEAQIAAFRKAKITAVENGVSSLFTMVRWKMYEPNVTNDGEKEICQAIINGVPYEQQNRATQVNAGIDIVNAFAKAYEASAPLFIDNAESVTDLLPANGQRVALYVVENHKLEVRG